MNALTNLTQYAAETEGGIGALGIDPIKIALQAGAFLILFFLIKKYALDGITKNLDDRRHKIDEGLVNAEEAEKRLREVDIEAEQEMARVRKEGEKVIEEASKESGSIVQSARDQAQSEHDQKLAEADSKIEQQKAKVGAGLKGEAASLVAMATEKIIGEKLDPKKDAALLDSALEQEIANG